MLLKFIFNKAILLHDYSILENIHCYIFLNFTVHPHSRTFRTNWCFPMDASASSPFLRERERSERIFQLLSPIHSRQKSRKKFNLFFFSWMKPNLRVSWHNQWSKHIFKKKQRWGITVKHLSAHFIFHVYIFLYFSFA